MKRSKQSFFGSRKGTRRRRQNRPSGAGRSSFKPRMEGLEARTVLSAVSVVDASPPEPHLGCDAESFCVENTNDSGEGSLRQAITDANTSDGPDVVQFANGLTGTIRLDGELSITDDVTIDGPNSHRVSISGNNASRVFGIYGAKTDVAIDDLTIMNGRADSFGGGILHMGGELDVTDVVFSRNHVHGVNEGGGLGGAIANFGAELNVDKSRFYGNVVTTDAGTSLAGAIFSGSDATIKDSSFVFNKAVGGGDQGTANGGAVVNNQGTMTIDGSTFWHNQAVGADGGSDGSTSGGAIANFGPAFAPGVVPSELTITDSWLVHNRSLAGDNNHADEPRPGFTTVGFAGGGAITNFNIASLTVENSVLSHNAAVAGDHSFATGAAEAAGAVVGIANGGAIQNGGGAFAKISGSQVVHNRSLGGDNSTGGIDAGVGAGGGINNLFFGTLVVENSVISHNLAQGGDNSQSGNGGGGGIQNIFGSNATIIGSTISHNRAIGGVGGDALGGGIDNILDSHLVFAGEGSQVTKNRAIASTGEGLGGGIYSFSVGVGTSSVMGIDETATEIADNTDSDASTDFDDIFFFELPVGP